MNVVIIIYLNLSIHRETEGKQLASSGSISSQDCSSLPCHQEMGSMPRNTSFVLPQSVTQPCIPVFRCQTCSGPFHPKFCQGRLHTNITESASLSWHPEASDRHPGDWGLQTAEAREVDALMATPGRQKMRAGGSLFHTHAYKPGPSPKHIL